MALNSTNQPIRWKERIGTWINEAWFFIVKVLKSLFGIRREDDLQTKGLKTAGVAAQWGAYFIMNNWINGFHLAIGCSMRSLGFSFPSMFGVIWGFDFFVAGTFLVIYKITGRDPSLGVNFRRAADTANEKFQLVGFLIMAWNTILAIFWTGPEKVITFFRKEIGTRSRIVAALIVLTAIQAFLWAALYYFAFGWVIKHL